MSFVFHWAICFLVLETGARFPGRDRSLEGRGGRWGVTRLAPARFDAEAVWLSHGGLFNGRRIAAVNREAVAACAMGERGLRRRSVSG